MNHAIRKRFWDQVDAEAEAEDATHPK